MSVYKKIAEVMKKVGVLTKDGRIETGAGYAYLSEEAITGALHTVCADIGLVVTPVEMELLENREDTLASSGKVQHTSRIRVTYKFSDAEDDSSFTLVQALGEGSDFGDKTLNKCMTAAFKYALRQSFMISSGDDPDKEASVEAKESKRRPVKTGESNVFKCGWPGCTREIRSTERYTAEKLAEWSKEGCDGQVLCYDHSRAWKAGTRPEETEAQPKTPSTTKRSTPGAQAKESPPPVCSTPGCGVALNSAQMTYSIKHFSRPLCPTCQKTASGTIPAPKEPARATSPDEEPDYLDPDEALDLSPFEEE